VLLGWSTNVKKEKDIKCDSLDRKFGICQQLWAAAGRKLRDCLIFGLDRQGGYCCCLAFFCAAFVV